MRMTKDLDAQLKERFCAKPFEFAALSPEGIGSMQCCWLTQSMGQVNERVPLQQVWNSPAAQQVRASILDGSYRYCRKDLCPHMHNGDLPLRSTVTDPRLRRIIDHRLTHLDEGPSVYQLNHDRSCNLACPSCRSELILETSGPAYDRMMKTLELSLTHQELLATREISITGSGDPFASKVYRDFLLNLDGALYPHLQINLFTNGVLFDEEMWGKLERIQRNIGHVRISMDGISEEVYRKTRLRGNLERVKANVKFLAGLRRQGFFKDLTLCFVVQALNFRDMIPFVAFARNFPLVAVHFQKIYNWGTYPAEHFHLQDVCDERSPDHHAFLELLRDPAFDLPGVDLGNLTPYRERALAKRP